MLVCECVFQLLCLSTWSLTNYTLTEFASVNELWSGRENFSDKKARMEAMESLKMMIRAWLDDFYPDMSEQERAQMANTMDISLVERKKEESMKTFFEINNVIRMSFIEMQYMKKVRLRLYLYRLLSLGAPSRVTDSSSCFSFSWKKRIRPLGDDECASCYG